MNKQVITRRNLPHWYVPGAAHFITYRLYGSLPQQALEQLQAKKQALLERALPPNYTPAQYRERVHKQLFAAYDDWLDRPGEPHWLANPKIAALIRGNLYHHDSEKYHLMAYCVMSNHVHVLLQPWDATRAANAECEVGERTDQHSPLASIMHSLKSYTAHEANRILARLGPFWQAEWYDHWVRDDDELERIVDYVMNNPIKAGLVQQPQDWLFCSCHDRFLHDGEIAGWLPNP
jgi:putative DNA methylase